MTHWQWQLVEALRNEGEQVLYPQLPDPDHPSLEGWAEVVHAELGQLGVGERIVVAHSLAVPLWLYVAENLTDNETVDRTLLVSPPSPNVLIQYDAVSAFATVPHHHDRVAAAAGTNRLVCSDNDPYCPEGGSIAYQELGLDCDIVPGGGHLDPDTGYGNWPSALAWCRDPSIRLRPR